MAGPFDNFFGGGGAAAGNMFAGNMYGDLLTPEQLAAVRRQSMMQVAAKLLESSGPSTTRRTLGQTLGGALSAGAEAMQTGQTNAVQQMLLKQKLDEGQQTAAQRKMFADMIGGGGGATGGALASPPAQTTPLTAQQALLASPAMAGRAGPTMDRAAMIGTTPAAPAMSAAPAATAPAQTIQDFLKTQPQSFVQALSMMPIPEAMKAIQDRQNMATKFGKPEFYMQNGKLVAKRFNELGESQIVPGLAPRDTPPSAIAEYEYAVGQGFQGSFQQFNERQRKASATTVDMTGGQKGFENEMKLGSAFKGESTYKEFNDMKTAFKQVVSSLSQGTPIGDVAGATKIMKLLDPGSVVRESELGIAMAAAGRLDRLQNYFNNMMTGQILTPTQRQDFERLATELYAAAADGYNKKRGEYEGIGQAYGFKNLDKVLGPQADVPSLMRPSTPAGAGGAARPPLSNIFGSPQ
jgi:hypothetical protein